MLLSHVLCRGDTLSGGGGIQGLQTTGSLELLLGGSGARLGMGLTYKATLETGASSQGLGDDDGMCDECFEEVGRTPLAVSWAHQT